MKNKIFLLLLLVQFSFSATSLAQNIHPPKEKFNEYIKEVYIDNAMDYIKPSSRRYKFMKDFYENRFIIIEQNSKYNSAEYMLLSEVTLNEKYNKNLKRDLSFSINNFNPFKYNFSFYNKNTQLYKVGGTDYFILIYPQKVVQNRK